MFSQNRTGQHSAVKSADNRQQSSEQGCMLFALQDAAQVSFFSGLRCCSLVMASPHFKPDCG